MGLGRKGGRTPHAGVAPSRGGRTVGDHLSRTASENCQMSQRWEKSSSPRSASGLRYSGSKTTVVQAPPQAAWRGMPNLVESHWMQAIYSSRGIMACLSCLARALSRGGQRWEGGGTVVGRQNGGDLAGYLLYLGLEGGGRQPQGPVAQDDELLGPRR